MMLAAIATPFTQDSSFRNKRPESDVGEPTAKPQQLGDGSASGWTGDPGRLRALLEFILRERQRVTSAIWRLGEYGAAGSQALIPLIGRRDDRMQGHIAFGLMGAGPDPRALPALLKMTEHPQARRWAIAALGNLGPAGLPAYSRLSDLLDYEPDVAAPALLRVGQGALAGETINAILNLKPGEEPWSGKSREMIEALVPYGIDALPLLPHLLDALHQKPEAVGRVLQAIGPAARSALPALLDELRTSTWFSKELVRAVVALRGVTPDLLGELRARLGGRDESAGEHAARFLGHMGDAALPALPDLVEVIQSAPVADNTTDARSRFPTFDPNQRIAAIHALGGMPGGAKVSVPILRELLARADEAVAVAYALAQLGPAARESLPEVLRAVETGSIDVETAIRNIRAMGLGAPDAAIPTFQRWLTTEVPDGAEDASHWNWDPSGYGAYRQDRFHHLFDAPPSQPMYLVRESSGTAGLSIALVFVEIDLPRSAIRALGAIRATEFVTEIANSVGDPLRHEEACRALGAIGSDASSAVVCLARALDDDASFIPAAQALGRIGIAHPEAMHLLRTRLTAERDDAAAPRTQDPPEQSDATDRIEDMCFVAAEALIGCGDEQDETFEVLWSLPNSEHIDRLLAGSQRGRDFAVAKLVEETSGLRPTGAELLSGACGHAKLSESEALLGLLHLLDGLESRDALWALKRLGDAVRPLIPSLHMRARDPRGWSETRNQCAEILRSLGEIPPTKRSE